MDKKPENRMDKPGDNRGDGSAKPYKKPTKPKTFKFEGKRNITLPHVGVVIPGATFTVQPGWERLMVFCIKDDKFTEVK